MLISVVNALLLGAATTLVLWAFSRTFLHARLLFSPEISVTPSEHTPTPARLRYRVKVKNVSLLRGVADVRFDATLVSKGLNPAKPDSFVRIRLDVSTDGTSSLGPGRNRVLTLRFSRFTEFMATNLADYGHLALSRARNRDLEQLMATLAKAGDAPPNGDGGPYVIVTALVNEAWSGKQYAVSSPRYQISHLRPGVFGDKIARSRRVAMRLRRRLRKLRRWLVAVDTRRHKDLLIADEPGG